MGSCPGLSIRCWPSLTLHTALKFSLRTTRSLNIYICLCFSICATHCACDAAPASQSVPFDQAGMSPLCIPRPSSGLTRSGGTQQATSSAPGSRPSYLWVGGGSYLSLLTHCRPQRRNNLTSSRPRQSRNPHQCSITPPAAPRDIPPQLPSSCNHSSLRLTSCCSLKCSIALEAISRLQCIV